MSHYLGAFQAGATIVEELRTYNYPDPGKRSGAPGTLKTPRLLVVRDDDAVHMAEGIDLEAEYGRLWVKIATTDGTFYRPGSHYTFYVSGTIGGVSIGNTPVSSFSVVGPGKEPT